MISMHDTQSNELRIADKMPSFAHRIFGTCVLLIQTPPLIGDHTAMTAILIVEDERIIAKGIEKQLRSMDYVVAGSASNGADAVRMAAELRPDMILMDISLGDGMDGVEAAGQIRALWDIPIVYLTADSDESTLQRAKVTDPYGFLLKPYQDRDLHTAIEMGLFRHKMLMRLRENEEWLAATLGSIGDGVVATDDKGCVRYMNGLAERLTGWTNGEALGHQVQTVFRIVNEFSREDVPNPAIKALASGVSVMLPIDTILINRDGSELPIDDSAAPIKDANGRISGSVLVFRDISERRRLEESLRQSQKMEALGRLAGGIAHDFNNVMQIISGFSEMLLDETQSADDRSEAARHIHEAGKRATTVTRQILAFSRQQMLAPAIMNLNDVVRDVSAMLRPLIGSNIEVSTDMALDLASIRADSTQLVQVLLNLAANARDAMGGGGQLAFETFNMRLHEGRRRRESDVPPGDYVVLTVADTGAGMSDETKQHLFEPFFTTKRVGEGTGLGLASAHGIIRQSGGHIEVDSEIRRGTTFRIFLPAVVESVTATPVSPRRSTERRHETILVVDDEPAVRTMIRRVLESHGFRIIEASGGPEALALINDYAEPIHLVITDMTMPQLSGIDVAKRLRQRRSDLRVLLMSGYSEEIVMRHSSGPSDHFLQKPFTIDALDHAVRTALDSRAASQPETWSTHERY